MTTRRCRMSGPRRWKHLATAAVASCCYTSDAFSPAASGPLHRQTQRSSLQMAAVLDQPTCHLESDYYSPSKMFLNNGKSLYSNPLLITTTERYGGHAISSTSDNCQDNDDNDNDNNMLGFRVLDTAKWNEPNVVETLPYDNNSPIKNQLASSIRRRQETSLLPAWFPWLPTKSQLEILKVTELREACVERSLKKSGNKSELQARLWEWTEIQHQKRILNARGSPLGSAIDMKMPLQTMYGKDRKPTTRSSDTIFRYNNATNKRNPRNTNMDTKKNQSTVPKKSKQQPQKRQPDSLEDWARNVDLDSLLNRRRAIRREAQEGRKGKRKPLSEGSIFKRKPTTQDLSTLTDAFEAPPSRYSNLEVKQMYAAAKEADQVGDRILSRQILFQLKEATPNDARIFRRLARMESEEGRVDQARKVLQEGLRLHPQNGFLWHGLGQLELKAHKDEEARRCFQKAIAADPSLPHAYHALGTLEHTHGRIAAAMKLLKEGIRYCPTNHRLHHALGDLYREAKMLELAETSYRRSLEHGNMVNHGFAYTALAYVAYEKRSIDECRNWLREAVSLNHGRNSRSWVAWGQMEEAEGNIDAARAVHVKGLAQYEHGLIHRNAHRRRHQSPSETTTARNSLNIEKSGKVTPISLDSSSNGANRLTALKQKLLKRVPSYRSGDKFVNVYRNWARLEERYGDEIAVNEVYTRATAAFPRDYQLVMKWAQYHARIGDEHRARNLFEEACRKVNNWHADPYRLYGEFEMSLGNYSKAKSILYRGAQTLSYSSDGGLGNRGGMAQLFHTWAVCEWYLDNLSRAEVLFDHALRLTNAGQDGSEVRSYILYSIARLEYFRGEYELAQHFVGLSLKDNVVPGGNSKTWSLWADIASAMGDDSLVEECEKQAEMTKLDEENGGVESLSRLLGLTRPRASSASERSRGPAMQHLMRRDPWNHKIFGQSTVVGGFKGVNFPDAP